MPSRRYMRRFRAAHSEASLLKPAPAALRALLWSIHEGHALRALDLLKASVGVEPEVPPGLYAAAGFIRRGPRAVRADILERLTAQTRALTREGPAPIPAHLQTLLGCDMTDLLDVLRAEGFRVGSRHEEAAAWRARPSGAGAFPR